MRVRVSAAAWILTRARARVCQMEGWMELPNDSHSATKWKLLRDLFLQDCHYVTSEREGDNFGQLFPAVAGAVTLEES